MTGCRPQRFREQLAEGEAREVERGVAVEDPCAVELNGLGYAVMMLTPEDLEDFAYGFCLSERLIDGAEDIVSADAHAMPEGTLLRIGTRPGLRERVAERVRHRISDSSCGLCGIENLEQALRPLPRVAPRRREIDPAAIFTATAAMRAHQPLNRATGAVHAAALCSEDGSILVAREDVGRHNAFDKLVGAMLRAGRGWGDGFALLSSRCSYELVETAALSGCPTLVTVSAPTTLALARAEEAGIELIALARSDSYLTAR
ncbi:formate dehydrogenase accessory sulfurtransferase FdhD [Sphingomonas sp. MAH-20]|uniref:Sulfur carrier protein FdhD n=1 Tax=Sphingomonas horti TaxID=2682842 RepID=A0A6I4J397_9SPHN|nr:MULTISPECIES: formate dehydrogenase accessory sulfurtransferase FdhD [Sphingomonas]MBA2918872.1 formate dehydrogenase accessory sulfurtransferase FdhD [Sphingomonas sp. CGMCC 1.13658]MVO78905.1 formate dehydrogenase accessory sulfurtransferase FdhD [Sphingomonas horti]